MAIKGAVLGDMLGERFEFFRPEDLDWKNVPLLPDDGIVFFTDDTVMSLAIKKALDGNLDLVNTMVEVGRHYPDCGYGGNFCDWILTDNHKPYNSWGNGSAMRVSYVGEKFEDYTEMQEMAERTALVSHNHPEGVKGAVVTATCVWMARHGKTKKEIYDYVLSEYPADQYRFSIARSLDDIRNEYTWSVSCMDTVPVAMICFYESSDYESFMRNIFSLECDSDTFGAVAGGVTEEFYGGFGSIDADRIINATLTEELLDILNGSRSSD